MSYTAETSGFPEQVWLGMKRGEWPVEAFPSEDMAQRWASQGGSGHSNERIRYVVGPVSVPRDLPARRARTVPASTQWED